ncbi:unnamed protein product [Aphanomyces euteiches]
MSPRIRSESVAARNVVHSEAKIPLDATEAKTEAEAHTAIMVEIDPTVDMADEVADRVADTCDMEIVNSPATANKPASVSNAMTAGSRTDSETNDKRGNSFNNQPFQGNRDEWNRSGDRETERNTSFNRLSSEGRSWNATPGKKQVKIDLTKSKSPERTRDGGNGGQSMNRKAYDANAGERKVRRLEVMQDCKSAPPALEPEAEPASSIEDGVEPEEKDEEEKRVPQEASEDFEPVPTNDEGVELRRVRYFHDYLGSQVINAIDEEDIDEVLRILEIPKRYDWMKTEPMIDPDLKRTVYQGRCHFCEGVHNYMDCPTSTEEERHKMRWRWGW